MTNSSCNSTYRLRYWNDVSLLVKWRTYFSSCNSTYRLRYWNASPCQNETGIFYRLQQYLPFTVLKHARRKLQRIKIFKLQQYLPFTVLKRISYLRYTTTTLLQQYLPFTVLKRVQVPSIEGLAKLQQYLSFTVLKLNIHQSLVSIHLVVCCNSTYRLRYWNHSVFCFACCPCWTSCNSTYRLRYWNSHYSFRQRSELIYRLQQYLPFTVLKLQILLELFLWYIQVATVLTVYGIETSHHGEWFSILCFVATVLTVYGIETCQHFKCWFNVAFFSCNSTYRLRYWNPTFKVLVSSKLPIPLQQYLPFTVLKLVEVTTTRFIINFRCNSTYRSRYAPKGARQQRSKATMRSAHLKYLNEEKVKRG